MAPAETIGSQTILSILPGHVLPIVQQQVVPKVWQGAADDPRVVSKQKTADAAKEGQEVDVGLGAPICLATVCKRKHRVPKV
jgi:hypothetical protein